MKYLNIIFILVLFSCSEDNSNSYTVSACAQQTSDGSIEECLPNEEGLEYLTNAMEFFQVLDKDFPGPKFPKMNTQYKVVNATNKGLLELEDGRKIALAGLKCDHEDLKKYLDGFLVKDKQAKIIFLPTGLETNNHIFAYVWEISEPMDFSNIDGDFNNIFNQPSETAISSKWCKPIKQDKHKYHRRYLEIEIFND